MAALIDAAMQDLRAPVLRLRELGWPAEVIAVNEEGWFGLRVDICLNGLRIPVEAEVPATNLEPAEETGGET
jgi:hypothetical protein